jgi:hypothetical protein
LIKRVTHFESIRSDSRITTNETRLKTSWAKTKCLSSKLSLPGPSAGDGTGTIEVDGIFGTTFSTNSETSSIYNSGAAGTCAKTAAEVENGVGGSRDAGTSAYTFRDTLGCRGRTDGGVGDGVGGSTGSKVEVGVDIKSLYVVRHL